MSSIDLHGQNRFEAKVSITSFLKECVIKKVKYAKIIHGDGSNILRDVVVNELKNNSYVDSYTFAHPFQGGSGVTVVTFTYNQ